MIIIKVKEAKRIDQTLKEYKGKCRKIKLSEELQRRRYYQKPSVKRRIVKVKAIRTMRYRREHDLI